MRTREWTDRRRRHLPFKERWDAYVEEGSDVLVSQGLTFWGLKRCAKGRRAQQASEISAAGIQRSGMVAVRYGGGAGLVTKANSCS